jgi:hypothetical protein
VWASALLLQLRNRLFSLTHAQDPNRRIAAKAVMRFKRKAREREHFRFTYRHCNIVQGGFFSRKKPLGIPVSVKSRIENAVAGIVAA